MPSLVACALAFAVCGLPADDTAANPAADTTADTATPTWLFPTRHRLPALLANPREPVIRGQLVYADPGATAFGPGTSGEVAIGGSVPVVLLAGRSDDEALLLGIEGAVFAHFSFDVVTRELVNTDWVFALPLVWHRGSHWLRLRYYHTSSHLGDEYQRRFGPSSINFSRDGADLTVYFRPGRQHWPSLHVLGLAAYAGALRSVNSHPEEEGVWRGRAGLELDPWRGRLWRPYGALDVELEEGGGHGARWTAQGGIWLPAAQRRPLRLVLEIMAGPSPMGQFSQREACRVALGLSLSP